ncbi:DUF3445 domain-containing protein [Rhodobacteraceae bacterium RKSG542]|uniref:heme-dependent oxidative N-demethylase family protein n=1 Tax=Pseudovibrio flavus TaxID=2529854 RepID=UPI0012BD0514|nr:DUF3445 domain-containing protein [Pseudovibrio flavus]MTI16554.1 DUF3445 domain-containing protein [Pseudovibrio flavus]
MSRFAYTPYDGSKTPFTVGLEPLDLAHWIEPDRFLASHLAEKARLFAERQDKVFAAEEGTHAAQQEVLDLIAAHVLKQFPQDYSRSDNSSISIRSTGGRIDLASAEPPLLTAAKLVQEDLVLMRAGEDGYRLAAAALCFPSSWALLEKYGRSMTQIHDGVPDFNGARMGQMTHRIFERLAVERPVWRLNWSLYPDGALHNPVPRRIAPLSADRSVDELLDTIHLRVEKQSLRRLPESGDILFMIRIYHDPLRQLAEQPNAAELIAGLKQQLLGLTKEQRAYKGLCDSLESVVVCLDALADGVNETSADQNRQKVCE